MKNDLQIRGNTLKFFSYYRYALDFIITRKLQFKKANSYSDETNIFYIGGIGSFSIPNAEVSCFTWLGDNIYNSKMWNEFAASGNGVCVSLEDSFFTSPSKLYIENPDGHRFYAVLPQYISNDELKERRKNLIDVDEPTIMSRLDDLHYFALNPHSPNRLKIATIRAGVFHNQA